MGVVVSIVLLLIIVLWVCHVYMFWILMLALYGFAVFVINNKIQLN